MSLYDKMRNDAQSEEERQRKKNELDKLRQMAASIGGKKEEDEPVNETAEAAPEPQELPESSAENTEQKEKKSGKIDLAELAAKASALGKK